MNGLFRIVVNLCVWLPYEIYIIKCIWRWYDFPWPLPSTKMLVGFLLLLGFVQLRSPTYVEWQAIRQAKTEDVARYNLLMAVLFGFLLGLTHLMMYVVYLWFGR